jgi:hypothetical protein
MRPQQPATSYATGTSLDDVGYEFVNRGRADCSVRESQRSQDWDRAEYQDGRVWEQGAGSAETLE